MPTLTPGLPKNSYRLLLRSVRWILTSFRVLLAPVNEHFSADLVGFLSQAYFAVFAALLLCSDFRLLGPTAVLLLLSSLF